VDTDGDVRLIYVVVLAASDAVEPRNREIAGHLGILQRVVHLKILKIINPCPSRFLVQGGAIPFFMSRQSRKFLFCAK
jgi:hypothetical protein